MVNKQRLPHWALMILLHGFFSTQHHLQQTVSHLSKWFFFFLCQKKIRNINVGPDLERRRTVQNHSWRFHWSGTNPSEVMEMCSSCRSHYLSSKCYWLQFSQSLEWVRDGHGLFKALSLTCGCGPLDFPLSDSGLFVLLWNFGLFTGLFEKNNTKPYIKTGCI